MLKELEGGFSIRGVKIGVIPDSNHVEVVAAFLLHYHDAFVVLDPVISAKNGVPVITGKGLETMKERLLPLVDCITPNLDEASLLLDRRITDVSLMEQAAMDIAGMGPRAVVLKGGHLDGDPTDILVDGNAATHFCRKRSGKTVHGTGCILSSALLSYRVRGYELGAAFVAAEEFVGALIERSFQPKQNGYFYASAGMESWPSQRTS
jgi:hydroxymethylpyrimidine kinase/phosphomethylpyrimidine kinase